MAITQVRPVLWENNLVRLIDQTLLPQEYTWVEVSSSDDMAIAISTMIVRGAPAIGVAAAYGMYLGAREITTTDRAEFLADLEKVAVKLRATRPTAVNLFWAINQMTKAAHGNPGDVAAIQQLLLQTAQKINADDIRTCEAIGDFGLAALPTNPPQLRLLTPLQRRSFGNSRLRHSSRGSAFSLARRPGSKDSTPTKPDRVYKEPSSPPGNASKREFL